MELALLLERLPSWQEPGVIEVPWREREALGHFHDALSTTPPRRVWAVIAVSPPQRRVRRRYELPLVAVSRFRSEYSVIEAVARSLARAILETGVVPIIQPIRQAEIESMHEDTPFVKMLATRGFRVWSDLL